jgi:hypothetical protein
MEGRISLIDSRPKSKWVKLEKQLVKWNIENNE